MAADVDEANSTLGDEAPRESNGGSEQLRGMVDGQRLFHDQASYDANREAPRSGASRCLPSVRGTVSPEEVVLGIVAPGSPLTTNSQPVWEMRLDEKSQSHVGGQCEEGEGNGAKRPTLLRLSVGREGWTVPV